MRVGIGADPATRCQVITCMAHPPEMNEWTQDVTCSFQTEKRTKSKHQSTAQGPFLYLACQGARYAQIQLKPGLVFSILALPEISEGMEGH